MDEDYPSRHLDRIMVRLPDGMRDRLKEAANANNRSMNAEVVARLERTFDFNLQEVLIEIARQYRGVNERLARIEKKLED